MQLADSRLEFWPKCWTLPNIYEGGKDGEERDSLEKLREMEKEEGRGTRARKRRFALPMTNQS